MSMLLALILAVLAYYFIIFVKDMENSITTLFFAIIIMLLKLKSPGFAEMNMKNLGYIVDFNTIGILLGMMIVVGFLKKSGFFQYAIINILRFTRGNFNLMLLMLMAIVAVTSAFLDNVVTILMTLPMIFLIADTMEIDPTPLVLLTIFEDNVGGMATLIGSPLNLVLGSESGKSFNDFLTHTGVFAIIAFLVVYYISRRWVKVGKEEVEKLRELSDIEPEKAVEDERMMKVSVTVFGFIIVGFMLHSLMKIELSYIALLGALTLLIIFRGSFEKVSKDIDWDTLFFYMGLYTISYSLEVVGVLQKLAQVLMPLKGNFVVYSMVIMWGSAFIIPFLSAVPGTLILAPVLKFLMRAGFSKNIWWAYAFGANLGTNFTPLGAVENLIGVAMLEKQTGRKIGFGEFMKYGVKSTVPAIVLASVWLLALYR